jgi:predicted DNA-binding protein (UPF0251 family)
VEVEPGVTYFKPRGVPIADLEVAELTVEELEALRLVDLEGLEQDQAAMRMGVSRRALWAELDSARRKVAGALVKGSAIAIRGGNYVTATRKFSCSACGRRWEEPFGTGRPAACPACGSPEFSRKRARCGCGAKESEG